MKQSVFRTSPQTRLVGCIMTCSDKSDLKRKENTVYNALVHAFLAGMALGSSSFYGRVLLPNLPFRMVAALVPALAFVHAVFVIYSAVVSQLTIVNPAVTGGVTAGVNLTLVLIAAIGIITDSAALTSLHGAATLTTMLVLSLLSAHLLAFGPAAQQDREPAAPDKGDGIV